MNGQQNYVELTSAQKSGEQD